MNGHGDSKQYGPEAQWLFHVKWESPGADVLYRYPKVLTRTLGNGKQNITIIASILKQEVNDARKSQEKSGEAQESGEAQKSRQTQGSGQEKTRP
jgi:hypothetical protein